MIGHRSFIACFFAVWLALPAFSQEVDLCSSLQPCTASRPVVVGRDETVSIVWRGRAFFDRVGRVVSDVGYFTLGDPASDEPLGVIRRPLMEQVIGNADGQAMTFSFRETLTVPGEISQRAAAQGARELSYIRQFSVNGMRVIGMQTIRLSAPLPNPERSIREGTDITASGLILRRLALRFEDGAAVASVERTDRLRAVANIDYDRAGLLEAVWEVATPATTRGKPNFRRLENVREYLGAGQEATLRSPALQTDQPGLYLLRLRLVQPLLEQRDIVLRYQVSGAATKAPARVPVLNATTNRETALGANTEFRWRRVRNTQAYQLELYDQPPEQRSSAGHDPAGTAPAAFATAPTTGLVLPSTTEHTRLSPAVLHQLVSGHGYYWRVVAIDTSGTILAASPLQLLRTEP